MIKFNTDIIRTHKITLMDCQVDLILESLTMYSYVYKYVCPKKQSETREEDLRISLVRDTISQIYDIYTTSKKNQTVENQSNEELSEIEKLIQNFY